MFVFFHYLTEENVGTGWSTEHSPLKGDFTSTVFPFLGKVQVVLVVKNLPANAGDVREVGSISGSGRSLGGEHGNPLQYSCLENSMDRGAWQATVAKSWT